MGKLLHFYHTCITLFEILLELCAPSSDISKCNHTRYVGVSENIHSKLRNPFFEIIDNMLD